MKVPIPLIGPVESVPIPTLVISINSLPTLIESFTESEDIPTTAKTVSVAVIDPPLPFNAVFTWEYATGDCITSSIDNKLLDNFLSISSVCALPVPVFV